MPKHARSDNSLSLERSYELWELDIKELTGHNIEAQGREEVNKMLKEG